MKNKVYKFLILLVLLLTVGCYKNKQFNLIVKSKISGKFICFPGDIKDNEGKLVNAEISGAEYYNDILYLVNDKQIPGKSLIMKTKLSELSENPEIEYLKNKIIVDTKKYEDITITLDNKYVIATTAFDRVIPQDNKWDNYNKIVYWKIDNEEDVNIIEHTQNDGVESSLNFRDSIKKSLIDKEFPEGPPYFKIEGLTVIPDNKILFGVRAYGKKYNNFYYSTKILMTEFKIKNGKIYFVKPCKLVYEFDTKKFNGVNKKIGLSGLEYDDKKQIIYLLTSYESEDEDFEGNIFYIRLKDFFVKNPPNIVKNKNLKPLYLKPFKPEGITVINKNKLFIIFDNDRKTEFIINGKNIKRKNNESFYEIYDLKN